jgi:cyclic pyranopterin monophosphate synthase
MSGPPDPAPPARELTHLDAQGRARMVDVTGKAVTARTAVASARVRLRPDTARLLAEGRLPKGDALATARLAGIMAAKRTPDLIPLCHVIALAGVEVDVEVDAEAGLVEITATARAADRTGVEMEALVAASTAALTVYDMTKAVEKGVLVEHVRLEAKTGGRSGDWHRAGGEVAGGGG